MTTHIGSVKVNQGRILPFWFNTEAVKEDYVVTEATTTSVVEDDKNITRYTGASVMQRSLIEASVDYVLENDSLEYTYTVPDTSNTQVSSEGLVSVTSPSQSESVDVTVNATLGGKTITRTQSVTLDYTQTTNTDVISGAVSGSAREALTDVIHTAVASSSASSPTPVYSTRDFDNGVFARSSDFLLSNTHTEAITCASPWNSQQGQFRAGTAITPRHVLVAAHYTITQGNTIKFVTADNVVIERTVVGKRSLSINADIDLLILDSDLPTTITPCKLFPSNFEDYLPAGSSSTSYAATGIPLLTINARGERASVRELLRIIPSGQTDAATVQIKVPSETSDLYPFYESTISGDSGSPVFSVIGTELWLMNLWWSAGSGTLVSSVLSDINNTITLLDSDLGVSTGYAATEGDLSVYTQF